MALVPFVTIQRIFILFSCRLFMLANGMYVYFKLKIIVNYVYVTNDPIKRNNRRIKNTNIIIFYIKYKEIYWQVIHPELQRLLRINRMEEITRRVEHSIPTDILDDLLTRFLICVPDSAKENYIRICFQIELAHWFYLDFYVSNDSNLRTCTIYEFAAHVFQHKPSLQKEIHNLSDILAEWKKYKQTVPTYGAILLSEGLTHVLLVKSYWAKASWGFPKGKVNEEEDPAHCAIREVLEETGFDISNHLNPDEWVESVINDQLVRLYIIRNIPMSTKFQPKTRCEIKSCGWFAVSDLPTNKKDVTPKLKIGVSPNAFFMVLPFVKKLKQICNGISVKRHRQKSSNSLSDCEATVSKYKNKSNLKLEEEKQKSSKRQDKKNGSKRQLFPTSCIGVPELCAPSWANFRFDQSAIIECFP